jgi:hemerythrin-like metal-binding protein
MPAWSWNNSFSVSDELMDEHHKKIFNIINDLHELLENDFDELRYISVLNDLKEYSLYHFSAEENLLEKLNYPKLMIQKIQHEIFTDKLTTFINKYDLNQEIMSLKMMSFLKEWLIKHILELDMDYKSYLSNKKS